MANNKTAIVKQKIHPDTFNTVLLKLLIHSSSSNMHLPNITNETTPTIISKIM